MSGTWRFLCKSERMLGVGIDGERSGHPSQNEAPCSYYHPDRIPKEKPMLSSHTRRYAMNKAAALLIVAASVIAFARARVIHVVVQGQSMWPNLDPNAHLLVHRFCHEETNETSLTSVRSRIYHSFLGREPQRGDIALIEGYGRHGILLKRIIGLPGEQVCIRNGEAYINGIMIDEPYISHKESLLFPKDGRLYELDVDQYFVVGDNRNASSDSRSFGPVTKSALVGRAWIRLQPLPRFVSRGVRPNQVTT